MHCLRCTPRAVDWNRIEAMQNVNWVVWATTHTFNWLDNCRFGSNNLASACYVRRIPRRFWLLLRLSATFLPYNWVRYICANLTFANALLQTDTYLVVWVIGSFAGAPDAATNSMCCSIWENLLKFENCIYVTLQGQTCSLFLGHLPHKFV